MGLIIVEGLPGAGKTSLTLALGSLQGWNRVGEILDEQGFEIPYHAISNPHREYFYRSLLNYRGLKPAGSVW
jgi:deoxyadenosine/deoxycytidine kinase